MKPRQTIYVCRGFLMIKINLSINKIKSFRSGHVVIKKEDCFLLLRRSSTDTWMPNHYGFPGGKIENHEDTIDGVARECKEETQLQIIPSELIFLPKCSKKHNHLYFYTTKYNGKIKLNNEHDDYKWVTLQEITDLKTVPGVIEVVSETLETNNDT